MQLEGLHHVTAITGDASLNVAFLYTDTWPTPGGRKR